MESRARSAGFSVMEIGNRKKRLAFLYEFPGLKFLSGVWGKAPSTPASSVKGFAFDIFTKGEGSKMAVRQRSVT